MDLRVQRLQFNIIAAGYSCGPAGVDGDMGPGTYAGFISYGAGRPLGSLGVLLGRAMAATFPLYQILTRDRICRFLAEATHETGAFQWMQEKGSGDGPDADPYDDYLERYDFRADLGNMHPGDGEKYRGRGIFQVTGADNYERMGRRIGIDLRNNPQRAAEPEIGVLTACIYWSDHGLNVLADAGTQAPISRSINRGSAKSDKPANGEAERLAYATRYLSIFPH